MEISQTPILPLYHEVALLAFMKCHATSVARWQGLVALSRRPERWINPERMGHQQDIAIRIGQALAELANEGVVERRVRADGKAVYRLGRDSSTSIVACRLVAAVRRRQELRQFLAAYLQHTIPSPKLVSMQP